MRIIAFRYWDSVVNRFIYSDEFDWPTVCQRMKLFFEKAENFSDGKIQQFTGLVDANGRRIWEGDIVENKNTSFYWPPSEVGWDGCGWAAKNLKGHFVPLPLTDDFTKPPHKNDMMFANLVKVGSVFENPELLNR